MKYCQGPSCHEHKTKDRIRGSKGDKHYETRKRSLFYYAKGNFCSIRCQDHWLDLNIERALDRFGRTTEPKRISCDQAWYKDSKYVGYRNDRTNYDHYIVNDLLGQRIPITQEQYTNCNTNNIKELIKCIVTMRQHRGSRNSAR